MTTLLDHTGLPLWVYILLIAVGSILLLVVVGVAVRCLVLRRRARRHNDFDSYTGGPMRKVTVRRGRVVPNSQHLSLTGSKFGMRQFGTLADTESTMTGRRSPFQWWDTIMHDRSHSRLDQMSQVETASISTRPTSRATTIATRRELLQPTPIQTPEKAKEPTTSMSEIPSPPSSPSSAVGPNRSTNFSRSFSSRGPGSPLTQRSLMTLSRISERSNHNSLLSTPTGPRFSADPHTSHPKYVDHFDVGTQSEISSHITSVAAYKHQLPPAVPFSIPSAPTDASELDEDQSPSRMPPSSFPQPRPVNKSPRIPSNPSFASYSGLTALPTSSQTSSHGSEGQPSKSFYRQPNSSRPNIPGSAAMPSSSQTSLHSTKATIPSTFYRQPNASRLNVAHTRQGSNITEPITSTSNLSQVSLHSTGPSGIYYDTQVPRAHTSADHWSSNASLGSQQQRADYTNQSRYSSTEQHRRQNSSMDFDVEQENVMGVLTVPGKKNNRVLRKKSLRRLQTANSLA